MHFTIFQHVPYESPGYILEWIQSSGFKVGLVNFYDHPELPDEREVQNLIVMGGPMNIFDDPKHGWLAAEREFIKRILNRGTNVLGVCLGAQFIAHALGAQVFKNKNTEVGWFHVDIDDKHLPAKYKGIFPKQFKTLHWHGDTFDLPPDAIGFASSETTENQAFIYRNAAAIQFHLEMTPGDLSALTNHNESLFNKKRPFVQKPALIIGKTKHHEANKRILFRFLETFFGGH